MFVQMSFKGRRVLVTGGAKGIGLGIVKKFVESEATVFVLDVDDVEVAEVQKSYPMVTFLTTDLRSWSKSRKLIQGIGPIHHLVNTAGICGPPQLFMDIDSTSIDEFFGLYFKPVVNISQVVAKGMIANNLENATIVNISSISDTLAITGLGMYSCTKAALTMLTKVMALELGEQNIRVNCVRPAMVNTEAGGVAPVKKCPIHENVLKVNERKVIKRLVEMSEVADAVLFLSSNASSMVTGSDILLDGGLFLS